MRKDKLFLFCIFGAFMLFLPIAFSQGIIVGMVFNESNATDTFIFGNSPTTNYGLNAFLETGATADVGDQTRRSLIDVANKSNIVDAVPVGSTINWLKLELKVVTEGDPTNTKVEDISAFPIKTVWYESSTHYNNFNNGGVNMTDFNGTMNLFETFEPPNPSAGDKFNVTFNSLYAQNLFDENLNAWDEGIILIHVAGERVADNDDIVYFRSSNAPTIEDRWKLWVNYTEFTDETPPTFSPPVSVNSSAIIENDIVEFGIILSDNYNLSGYSFAHNISGTLANETFKFRSGTSINATQNLTVTASYPNVVGYQFFANDSYGNTAQTEIYTFEVSQGEIPPKFVGNPSVNDSYIETGDMVNIGIGISDSTGLSGYRIADNQSGTMTNESFIQRSGTSINATYNITITATYPNVVGYQFFANDSLGNVNTSIIYTFQVRQTNVTGCNGIGISPLSHWKMENDLIDRLEQVDGVGVQTYVFTGSKGANDTGNFALNLSSGFVNLSNNFIFDGNDVLTISAWVKTSYTSGYQTIFSKRANSNKYQGYQLYLDHTDNNKPSFTVDGITSSSDYFQIKGNTAIPNNVWSHIIVTYNGNESAEGTTIYVNGDEVPSYTIIKNDYLGASITTTSEADIGSQDAGHYNFYGDIDEVAVFDVNITNTQAGVLYNCGFGQFYLLTELDLHLQSPLNNTITNETVQTLRYYLNVTGATVNLYINGTFNQSDYSISGINSFNPITFDINSTYAWKVNTTRESFSGESDTWLLSFNQTFLIPPPPIANETAEGGEVPFNQCAFTTTNYGAIVGVIFFFLLSFGIIAMGWIMRHAIVGIIGGFMLLTASLFLYYCFAIIGFMVSMLSIWVVWSFLSNGYKGKL